MFGVLFATIIAAPAALAQTPPPGSVQVIAVISGGTGCPQGSAQVVMAPDASAFTVLYDAFSVTATSASPNAVADCEVQIQVNKPRLMGFAIDSADFRGFVALDAGMMASQTVVVESGSVKGLRQISAEFGAQRFDGPLSQEYVLSARRNVRGPKVLDCVPPRESTQIVIRSQIRVAPKSAAGNGQMTVDSADGKVAQRYNLQWQNCGHGNGVGRR